MRQSLRHHPLGTFFRDLVEEVFPWQTGLSDGRTLEYLSELLLRFAFMSELYRFRNLAGRRLGEVAELLYEAQLDLGVEYRERERELRRHVGDFTLFWLGVFPEALPRLQAAQRFDHLVDYVREGRKAYYQVSLYDSGPYAEDAALFRRLSTHFELVATGLHAVRGEWERRAAENFRQLQASLA